MIARARLWRPLTIVVGTILLVIICAYSWGFQTAAAFEYRHIAKERPILWATPKALLQTSANPAKGLKLSPEGFEFEVPWTDLDLDRSKVTREENVDIASFVFRSGIGIVFFGPGKGVLSDPKLRQGLRYVLGSEATQSNFALLQAELDATPDQIKPWSRKDQAIQTSVLLNMKALTVDGGETGIFRIQQNVWKGFQFDDPAQKPKKVSVDLYDIHDHKVVITFSVAKSSEAIITQQEINRVLGTLVAVPANPSGNERP